MEAITLMADLDAGATGAMTGGGYPTASGRFIGPVLRRPPRREAMAAYARWLPLINYENRQCGLQACKVLMREGRRDHPPTPCATRCSALPPATRAGLIEIARNLDPVVLALGPLIAGGSGPMCARKARPLTCP